MTMTPFFTRHKRRLEQPLSELISISQMHNHCYPEATCGLSATGVRLLSYKFTSRQQTLFNQFAELGAAVAQAAAEHDASAKLDHSNWRRISDAGIWRLPVPCDLGGLGGTWSDCAAALEGLATTVDDLGFMITTLGHVGALRVVLAEGTARQKLRWVEPLMRGDIGVTAMTEETGGSDLARMRLAAEPSQDGWKLSGQKVHITNAPVCKLGMIAGRIPSLGQKRDITMFFVDMDTPGISIGPIEDNLGIRTSPTANIEFDRVALNDDNIIGQPGNGLRILYGVIAFERALYGAIASGMIEGMIVKAMARVEERVAFNHRLADYQYVQGRITDMKMASVICHVLTYAGLAGLEAGASDASIVCSTAKYHAGELLLSSAEHLVQLHGHTGFMNNDLSRHLRDAVGMRIAGGTSDIQRINIFNQMRRQVTVANSFAAAAE